MLSGLFGSIHLLAACAVAAVVAKRARASVTSRERRMEAQARREGRRPGGLWLRSSVSPTRRRSPVRRLIILAVVVAGLTAVSPASAITNGTADGNGHPNVGGLVAPTQYPDGTWIYCSGTLISPTVVLTAAHCAEDGERVGVTFDTAYEEGDKVYYGTFHADPLYNQSQSDPHDIAVVVLDKPVRGITPAELPTANSLSNLSGAQTFTSVGYGAYEVTQGPGGHQ